MKITEHHLSRLFPNAGAHARTFAPWLSAAALKYQISTRARVAAFLAQVGHESGQLKRMVENLNYTAQALQRTWPKRFDAALAAQVAGKPVQIANIAYGKRMGNSAPGDGWKYRGRGLIQVTGKENYLACGEALGLDLVLYPEWLEQPEYAALSAGWYWSANGLNELADAGEFEAITRRINGGMSGQGERLALYGEAQAMLV